MYLAYFSNPTGAVQDIPCFRDFLTSQVLTNNETFNGDVVQEYTKTIPYIMEENVKRLLKN